MTVSVKIAERRSNGEDRLWFWLPQRDMEYRTNVRDSTLNDRPDVPKTTEHGLYQIARIIWFRQPA
jgi:hypothetical protein